MFAQNIVPFKKPYSGRLQKSTKCGHEGEDRSQLPNSVGNWPNALHTRDGSAALVEKLSIDIQTFSDIWHTLQIQSTTALLHYAPPPPLWGPRGCITPAGQKKVCVCVCVHVCACINVCVIKMAVQGHEGHKAIERHSKLGIETSVCSMQNTCRPGAIALHPQLLPFSAPTQIREHCSPAHLLTGSLSWAPFHYHTPWAPWAGGQDDERAKGRVFKYWVTINGHL